MEKILTKTKFNLKLYFLIILVDLISKGIICMIIPAGEGYSFFNNSFFLGNVRHIAPNRFALCSVTILVVIFVNLLRYENKNFRIAIISFTAGSTGNIMQVAFFGYATNWVGLSVGKFNQIVNFADICILSSFIYLLGLCTIICIKYLKNKLSGNEYKI